MNIHEISLDVSKIPANEPSLYLGQGDKNGTTLKAAMFDNGEPLSLSGYSVTFSMRSPDAQDFYEVAGTVSGNVATFLIDETYAAGHPGVTDVAYINVINGTSSITSSSRLRVVVLQGAKDGVMPAPAYTSEIEQFLDESQAAVDEIIDEAQEILDHGIPLMASDTRGGAKLGNGLEVDANENLNVKPATSSSIGAVKPDGTSITVDSDGTLHGGSYALPTMSSTTKGGAKLGGGLSVSNDVLSVAPATSSAIGGVKPDGTTITVDNDGTLHGSSSYELPTMSTSQKGGAKVGTGLSMSGDALGLSGESYTSSEKSKLAGIEAGANNYVLPKATTSSLGGVKPDGTSITVDSDGTIHGTGTASIPTMSASTKGGAKLGDGLTVDSSDKLNLGPLVKHSTGQTDGSAIFGVQGEGYAEQTTTTGKNLLPQKPAGTSSGVTFTPLSDGGVKLSGTASGAIGLYYATPTLAAGTYTLSSTSLLPSGVSITVGGNSISSSVQHVTFTKSSSGSTNCSISIANGVTVNATYYAQLETGSSVTAFEPYTGGVAAPNPDYPQPIMVARGRNLLDIDSWLSSRTTYTKSGDVYTVTNGGTAWSNPLVFSSEPIEVTISGAIGAVGGSNQRITLGTYVNGTFTYVADFEIGNSQRTATANALRMDWSDFGSAITLSHIQLEAGTTPTPYVPYGYVGLEVTANGQTTVTPVPLPSKGFLGALPDGAKDTLTIDSAGCVVVGNATIEIVLNGSESWDTIGSSTHAWRVIVPGIRKPASSASANEVLSNAFVKASFNSVYQGNANGGVGTPYDAEWLAFCNTAISTQAAWTTWLSSNPVTVLCPLATPTTESLGYIDLPALPEGATVTIPELDNVGVDYWVKGIPEVTEYGQAMQARLQGEIDEAEQAIADMSAANTRTIINTESSFTSSTSFAYTGASITIPANTIYALHVLAVYSRSQPYSVGLLSSSTENLPFRRIAYASDASSCFVAGYSPAATTLYVWAKYESADPQVIRFRGWHMPAQ